MLKPWCVDVLTMVCEQHVWYIHWFILLILSHRTLYDAQSVIQSDLMIHVLIILMTWCLPWCDNILLCTMMCTYYIHIICWWWLHILDDDSTYWLMMVHTWWHWCKLHDDAYPMTVCSRDWCFTDLVDKAISLMMNCMMMMRWVDLDDDVHPML